MSKEKFPHKSRRPRFIHFLIAFGLALGLGLVLLIVDRGVAHLYAAEPGSRDIILYTDAGCPDCEALRRHLKAYDAPYRERDTGESLNGMLGWWALGRGREVPLSVIGETLVYGYDIPMIDAALKELGYAIKEQAASPAAGAVESYPSSAALDAALEEEIAGEASEFHCEAAEIFEYFYATFKADDEFRLQRTRFPLRTRVLSGSGSNQTEEVFEVEKDQILDKEELVYLDQEILRSAGYSEGIYINDENQADIRMGPEDGEPLTIHRFKKVSGCWFLVEFVSFEYSGSTNILAL